MQADCTAHAAILLDEALDYLDFRNAPPVQGPAPDVRVVMCEQPHGHLGKHSAFIDGRRRNWTDREALRG